MSLARLLLVSLLAAALVTGCGADDEPGVEPPEPPPVEPEPPEEPPSETASCTNEQAGYTVEYPADWHANEGNGVRPCSFFDPEPVDVPEATEFFGAAVIVQREPLPAEEIVEGPDPTREVLEQEETEIAGYRAFRMEAESTGDGLLDAGIRYYQVVVDVDGESLLVSTYDLEEHEYERNREVVDQMAESLEIAPAAGAAEY